MRRTHRNELLLVLTFSDSILLASLLFFPHSIIVNSSLPGALIVVVLLKAQEECADTAAAVSKVYLPSYLVSILTIAAWCSVGLWFTLPDEDGNSVCQQI